MFYQRYVNLCEKKGVSPSRAALEAGLSKASVSKWKREPNIRPSGNVIGKLTRYFGVTVSDLLGEQINEENFQTVSETGKEELSKPFAPSQEYLSGERAVFYDRFVKLCRRKGVSPSRAALEAGLSKSTVTKWKQDPQARPNGTVMAKLTEYFGIPTSELLGEGVYGDDPRPVTEEEIKFALFGGSGDITREMYEEVRSFAAYVKAREAAKRQE